jgi:cAMP-dependent protein kinase regulator
MQATENIQFFQKLKDELGVSGLTMCLKYLLLEKHNEGEFIFKQGEKGDKFYIILTGTVGIYIKQNQDTN